MIEEHLKLQQKERKIISNIINHKIGKYEFMEKYAFSKEDLIVRLYEFIRNELDYTKKELTLKQLSHRIFLCIGLYNNMFTISNQQFIKDLTKFDDENDKCLQLLQTLRK